MATTILDDILGRKPSPAAAQGGQAAGKGGIPGLARMEGAGIRKVPLPVTPGVAGNNAGNAPKQPERITYTDMYKRLNPYPTPTAGQLERERKKKRREQIFAAIGDGISALSNLYFTTQYAPNMYSGRNTASQRTKERWDRLVADRNANMAAYINGLMKARQADDEYKAKEREWKRQLGLDKVKAEREKAEDARAEEEEKRKRELHPFEVRTAEGKAKAAESQAKYADDYEASKVERNKASAGASRASASASYARARAADGGSRYHGRFRGNDYKTSADYEKAVMDAVRVYGDISTDEVLERDYWGNPTKTRKKSIAELAAEVEEKDKNGLGWGLGDNTNETDW